MSRAKLLAALIAGAACAASLAPAGAVTYVPSQTIKAGTRIACVLDKSVRSSHAKYGDSFMLRVVDTTHPVLHGSEIVGYLTDVQQPSGMTRARIGFWLTTIRLPNGKSKPLSAFVVSKRVVPMNASEQHPSRQMTPPLPYGMVTPGPIAWQMRIGGGGTPTISTRPSGLLGGYVYAASAHEAIVIPAGVAVTVELQSNLKVP